MSIFQPEGLEKSRGKRHNIKIDPAVVVNNVTHKNLLVILHRVLLKKCLKVRQKLGTRKFFKKFKKIENLKNLKFLKKFMA